MTFEKKHKIILVLLIFYCFIRNYKDISYIPIDEIKEEALLYTIISFIIFTGYHFAIIVFKQQFKYLSSIYISIVTIIFFYGYIFTTLNTRLGELNFQSSLIKLSIFLILIYSIYYLLYKFEKILSIAIISLFSFSVIDIGKAIINKKPISNSKNLYKFKKKANLILIVFDEYASNESLKQDLGYNNPICNIAQKYNFKSIKQLYSSYNFTLYSTNSLLNNSDVNNFSFDVNFKEIYFNYLSKLFRFNNYKVINKSIFKFEKYKENKNEFLFLKNGIFKNTIFELDVLRVAELNLSHSIIEYIVKYGIVDYKKFSKPKYYQQLNQLEENFSRIISKRSDTNFFAYYHFLLPHGPFIESTKDSFINKDITEYTNDKYIDNIKKSNEIIERLIKKFDKSSIKANTVLVILSDHKNRSGRKHLYKEKNKIFNIFYLPDSNKMNLNDSMTNNALLYQIINYYFN